MMINEAMVQIKILIDIVKKKKQLLNEIYQITENQSTVLEHDPKQINMFEEMRKEKQLRMDELNQLDEQFMQYYENVKSHILNDTQPLAESLKQLKAYVKEIGVVEISIRVLEEKNKHTLQNYYTKEAKQLIPIQKDKKQALQSYQHQKKWFHKNRNN